MTTRGTLAAAPWSGNTWCPICAELSGDTRHNPAFRDQEALGVSPILEEMGEFVVLSAVGALVPGYVMLTPRRHVSAMGLLGQSKLGQLPDILDWLDSGLRDRFHLPVVMFEHGCSLTGARAGACVDHAHVHAMPIDCAGLVARDLRSAYGLEHCRPGDREALCGDGAPGYVWVRDPAGREFVGSGRRVPSQAGRRAVAQRLGVPDQWDWAMFPQLANMRATITRFVREGHARVG